MFKFRFIHTIDQIIPNLNLFRVLCFKLGCSLSNLGRVNKLLSPQTLLGLRPGDFYHILVSRIAEIFLSWVEIFFTTCVFWANTGYYCKIVLGKYVLVWWASYSRKGFFGCWLELKFERYGFTLSF